MQVRRIMNTNVVSLTPDDNAAAAARILERHNIGALPVCSKDGRLRGMVTDRDIALRCVALDAFPAEVKLREIMTRGVVSVSPDDDVAAATRIMTSEKIRRLPVVENGRVVGMFTLSDLASRSSFSAEVSSALAEISAPQTKYKRI